jgi:MOSC domain-containing protein YiiM
MMQKGKVIAVSKSSSYTFNKYNCDKIMLITGIGVEGDIHSGKKVKHRSRVRKNPDAPNLRQVHLMHTELFEELKLKDFKVSPGQMGENITTEGLNILDLPKDTILKIGESAEIQVTGLRNPCNQINSIQKGLMQAVLDKDENGNLIRKAGIMSIVLKGGEVKVGDKILVELPEKPHTPLEKV